MKVQEELLHHPGISVYVSIGDGISLSKMLKFYVKDFYVMDKASYPERWTCLVWRRPTQAK